MGSETEFAIVKNLPFVFPILWMLPLEYSTSIPKESQKSVRNEAELKEETVETVSAIERQFRDIALFRSSEFDSAISANCLSLSNNLSHIVLSFEYVCREVCVLRGAEMLDFVYWVQS